MHKLSILKADLALEALLGELEPEPLADAHAQAHLQPAPRAALARARGHTQRA